MKIILRLLCSIGVTLLVMLSFTLPVGASGPSISPIVYGEQLQVRIAYDGVSSSTIGYDSSYAYAANEKENRTAGTTTGPFAGFAGFLAAKGGTRALRLPATDASLAGTRTLGYTMPNGNVFLQPGLSRAEQLSTLRHESVHSFFSPRGSGPVSTFRQNLGQWGYDNSQLLRFTEEAIAETYGSGSLLQGLRHPFVNGYVSPGGVLLEGGGLIGAGYLGYQLGTGN